jgi:hypothetical protein
MKLYFLIFTVDAFYIFEIDRVFNLYGHLFLNRLSMRLYLATIYFWGMLFDPRVLYKCEWCNMHYLFILFTDNRWGWLVSWPAFCYLHGLVPARGGAFVLIIDTVYILVCDLVSQTVIGSYGIKKDCNCNCKDGCYDLHGNPRSRWPSTSQNAGAITDALEMVMRPLMDSQNDGGRIKCQ